MCTHFITPITYLRWTLTYNEISYPIIPTAGSSRFVPRTFRTQVISYHFDHFEPIFIFILVISYPVWSFCAQFGHFVPTFIFLFRPQFLHQFRTQVISYPESFRTQFSHFVPRYEMTWVSIDLFHFIQTNFEMIFLCCILEVFERERKRCNLIHLLYMGTRATYEPQHDQ